MSMTSHLGPSRVIVSVWVVWACALCGCDSRTGEPTPGPRAEKSDHTHHASSAGGEGALGGPAVGSAGLLGESVEVVNIYCPVLVGQLVGSTDKPRACDRRLVRTFEGKSVGFCDPECVKAWDDMTNEQRQRYLDDAIKLEASSGG